eukprot:210371-Chlamydomonas_euryale.AAC.1
MQDCSSWRGIFARSGVWTLGLGLARPWWVFLCSCAPTRTQHGPAPTPPGRAAINPCPAPPSLPRIASPSAAERR